MQNEKPYLIFFRALAPLYLKNSFFIFAFVLLFSFITLAQSNSSDQLSEAKIIPADFVSDGCSLFPDCDYGDCCEEHDKTYYFGGTSKERLRADKTLYKCVRTKKGFHHKIIAPLMFVGVRLGGVSWLPTPFRWGFGTAKIKKTKNNSPAKTKNDKDD